MSSVDGSDALAELKRHYEDRSSAARESSAAGVPVAGFTSNTVPWELLRAAGFFPVLLSPRPGPTPQADRFMEPIFDRRSRGIFDGLVGGDWSFLRLVVLPRTSEAEHKLYLYLEEVVREGAGGNVPPLYLYDLLHSRSPRSRKYGLERTEQLKAFLEETTGRPIGSEELAEAIRESNGARKAVRQLLRLRRGPSPKLAGAEALAAVGAFYFMDRRKYGEVAAAAEEEVRRRAPLKGPRILVKGALLDTPSLHRAIEAHGAVVVGEDDWWGSRCAGRDIDDRSLSLAGVFGKYYLDAPSPRVFPVEAADRWFRREVLHGVEGVIFYLPPADDVFGWDYPRQLRFLESRGIPSLLVRDDAGEADVSPETHARLEAFLAGLPNRRAG